MHNQTGMIRCNRRNRFATDFFENLLRGSFLYAGVTGQRGRNRITVFLETPFHMRTSQCEKWGENHVIESERDGVCEKKLLHLLRGVFVCCLRG